MQKQWYKGGILLTPLDSRMAHRVYPQNPAVPMQGSVGPAAGHRRPVQPPGYSHNPAGMNAATPPGVYANQGQPGVLQSSTVPAHLSGGRQTTGHRYPGPPATQVHCIHYHEYIHVHVHVYIHCT